MNHIFVTGFWRSGTSLLLRLFDGHPQVFAMPQMTGMATLLEKYPGFEDQLRACRDEFHLLAFLSQHAVVSNLRHLIRAGFEAMDFTPDGVAYPMRFDFGVFARTLYGHVQAAERPADLVYGYQDAVRRAWLDSRFADGERVFARQQGHRMNRFPGEDTVRFAMEQLPETVVVELVRDPLFQVGSALRADPETSLEEHIVAWSFAYHHARRNKAKYGADRYRQVRYEDLVLRREDVLRDLAALAGVEYDPCLLEPTFNGQPWQGNSQFTREKKSELRTEPHLSPAQIVYLDKALGDCRVELGYDPIDSATGKTTDE